MNITLSYCRVSACDRVRSSFQANASSRSSPARSGRCRSLWLAGALAKRALWSAMKAGRRRCLPPGWPHPPAAIPPPSRGQALDQAILQRLVGALDPPFGRARIGANDVDVERVQGAAELGHPVTAKRAWMVDPKDAVLVAVECDRLAPGLQIGAGRMEIGKEPAP